MPSPRLVPILAATLGLAVSAEIPAEQALGIYGQTAPAHRELSPLWGMVSLKSGLLRNLRLYGAYGPAPLAELPRHPGLHGANDHPQDAVAGVIQYLFPSPDGVNFVPNQRTKDPIGALSREREKGLPRILALLDAITFRKGFMADARGASSSRATGSPDEAEQDLRADVIRILGGGSPDPDSGYHRILGPFATMLARGVRQEVADGGRAYPPRVVEMALLGYAWTVADHVDELYRAFSPELLLGPPERRPLPPAGQAYPDARLPGVLERMEVHRAGGGEPVLPDELAVFLNDQRTQGPLPELINYAMARHGEARYPDCGETSLRNFFNIAFTHEGVFSEVRFAAFLGRFPAPPTAKLMELQTFYRRFPRIVHQTTQAARDAWSAIVSGLNHPGDPLPIVYRNGTHNLKGAGLRNMLNLIAHLLPDPLLNGPWQGGPGLAQATGKLDRLCELVSTEGRTFAWQAVKGGWEGMDFGTLDFTLNREPGFAWTFRPGHFAMHSLVNRSPAWGLRQMEVPADAPLLAAWRDHFVGIGPPREAWHLFATNLDSPDVALNAIQSILDAHSGTLLPTMLLLVEKVIPIDADAYEALAGVLHNAGAERLGPPWYPIPFVRALPQEQKAALFLAADIPGQSPQMALWVPFWIQHGLDPSTRFLGGVSILAWCAGSGSLPLVQEALRAGARANDLDERGLTPLLGVVMAWKENPVFSTDGHALVQVLLDAGADPLLANGGLYAPLGLAQKLGLAELAGQFERNLMEKAERKGAF